MQFQFRANERVEVILKSGTHLSGYVIVSEVGHLQFGHDLVELTHRPLTGTYDDHGTEQTLIDRNSIAAVVRRIERPRPADQSEPSTAEVGDAELRAGA
jgi:hypothetical protein